MSSTIYRVEEEKAEQEKQEQEQEVVEEEQEEEEEEEEEVVCFFSVLTLEVKITFNNIMGDFERRPSHLSLA